MERFLPSEIARLIYGYLKTEKNHETAECFLKSSPHLKECYEMFKASKNFNLKVNGFLLHDVFEIFGAMCSMINERIPDTCESKTLIEKLQYLLDLKHMQISEDKCIETELKMVDKCIGCMVVTENKSTCTDINSEEIKMTTAFLETPSFSEIIPCNVSKAKEIDITNETNEINPTTYSSPCVPSTLHALGNNNGNEPNISEEKNGPLQNFSPKNIQDQFSYNQPQYQQIPEATSLESMPGLSEDDKNKDSSVIIDTGELVDTFLSDQSLLEKIADTINKSIETQKDTFNIEEGNVLDPPTLEKALDSTQSDPQIKNVLDEFLVFNVDNPSDDKKTSNDTPNSIKSRLRSAKKNDDLPGKSKKNILNTPKHTPVNNEESTKIDTNIVLINESNIRPSIFESYDLLSHQVIFQPNNSNVGQTINFENTKMTPDDYLARANYVKIAPKISTMPTTHQVPEKRIFPKRKKRPLEEFGIRSKFRKSKINSIQPPESIQSQPIIIEVPNQNSIETQTKYNKEMNNINNSISLSEISKVKNIIEDTPNDRLKPPKNKSMSTPRRRSTHIRCLDFSTPQPKPNSRDQARSKLFCDSPKKCEKIVEEPSSSPIPKLQADWGSVNGFESIVKKESIRHWDTDIREMVGAGVLTSDADGRKTRKKKTPRKKIQSACDINNPESEIEEQNNSIQKSESTTDKTIETDISKKLCSLNDQNSNEPLLDVKLPKEQSDHPVELKISDKDTEFCSEKPMVKSDSLNSFSDLKSLIKPSEFPILLETPDKATELYNETPSIHYDSLKNLNDPNPLKQSSEYPVLLETPNKFEKICNNSLPIESDVLKTENNLELLKTNINEQENNLNQSNTVAVANTDNTSSISETISNHNGLKSLSFKLPENKKNEPDVNFEERVLPNHTKTNYLNELSPVKSINIQSVKQNQVETPYKCDDSAVDVPETPISKLIREYDPSKLVTPLPCTPEHYDDSLTETPLTKVFRETSYLNRPPISPFPPTPGNSMSVDTLIVPLEQDNSKLSHGNDSKINGIKEYSSQPLQTTIKTESPTLAKKVKVKPTPLKAKQKLSAKTKIKNNLKKKSNVDGKKKQVYESVKVELFGSVNSSSSSADELEKTNDHKKIVIDKKSSTKEKTSGFKPIPKRKSIQLTNIADQIFENSSLNEHNTKVDELPLTKSTVNPKEKITLEDSKKTSNIKQPIKSKKSMVHFDDPVGEFFNSPSSTPYKNKTKIENKNKTLNDQPEQLIGLSRYLNKSSTFYEQNSLKKTKIKTGTETNASNLNKSDSSINYLKLPCEDNTKLTSVLNYKSQTCMSNEINKLAENCTVDENNKSNNNKNSTIPIESKVLLNTDQFTSLNNKISDKNMSEKEDNDKSFENYETSNNSMKNTSCITIVHSDESEINWKKVNDPLNNIEWLKKPKVYEVITDDDEHVMIHLTLSKKFVFLDISSEVHNIPQSNSVPSPLLPNKKLSVSSMMEPGELRDDCHISMPCLTSTPKDIVEKKDDKQNRARRSPSFWDDSVHNFPTKHRDDRHRESNRWSNKCYRDNRFDKKSWPNKSSRYHDNRFRSQRSQGNVKREFSDTSIRDKERLKYRDEKRRSYRDFSIYDDRKIRDRLEEPEWVSRSQRKSQNDLQKLNRAEDIVKKASKRPSDRADYKIPPKVSKVEHQRLLKNVDVDEFLCVVHGQK